MCEYVYPLFVCIRMCIVNKKWAWHTSNAWAARNDWWQYKKIYLNKMRRKKIYKLWSILLSICCVLVGEFIPRWLWLCAFLLLFSVLLFVCFILPLNMKIFKQIKYCLMFICFQHQIQKCLKHIRMENLFYSRILIFDDNNF